MRAPSLGLLAVALIGPSAPQEVIRRMPNGAERRFQFVSAPRVFAVGAEKQIEGSVPPAVMIESGMNIEPIITHRYSYKDFQKGFDAMRSGQSGKVILDWDV